MKINERGITLLEVLATLTILGFLISIIFSIFINGINYSSKAKDTVLIQQETNYLLTLLKEQHENQSLYSITVSDNHKQVIIVNDEGETFNIGNEDYEYYMKDSRFTEQNKLEINPMKKKESNGVVNGVVKIMGDFHVELLIKSSENPSLEYRTKTILSRL